MDKSHLTDERIDMFGENSQDIYALMKFKEAIDLKLKNLKAIKEQACEQQPDLSNIGFHLNLKSKET